MRIDVIDHHVDALRDRPALLWRCDQTSVLLLDVAEHDHAVAEVQLGMGNFSALAGTTIFRAKPKTVHSQSMAAAASR